ncbi:hypothetical protein HH308_06840 [Gordonia sp. TBRC 11910]|uniref:Integral membrane protein n=1 Tax=Gordonia asplenii TaxID=2725283 RepID=A0A848KS35_9ACTN|nr:hypothetical protein [Gordonia asplenii]NMO00929.1 hypothetical protein [Gordonia asplenii]
MTPTTSRRVSRVIDAVVSVLLALGQIVVVVAMFGIALGGGMATGNCFRPDPCGSQSWLTGGMWVGIVGAAVIPVGSWILAGARARRGRYAWWVVLCGLVLLVVVATVMAWMIRQATP